jgi:tRNA dimethylallyltransferase
VNKAAVFFLVGPSAAGKSAVALELARRRNGEIVSCDAMQVYREISIASDKPSPDDRARVAHHLIDVVSVEEEFNAARYRALAVAAIEDILSRGKCPVVCGGSGMYVMALLDGLMAASPANAAVRERLEAEAGKAGLAALHLRLTGLDPAAAAKISANDPVRIIRALEVIEMTGELLSTRQARRDGLWGKYDIRVTGLTRPRAELYRRAEARIDRMFEAGLVDEIRQVMSRKLSSSAAGIIGIPEVGGYLSGAYDRARAEYLLKLNTRHYIKRQLTWFRKDARVQWIEVNGQELPGETAQRIL